ILFVPFAVLALMPFARWSLTRFFFTYVVPVIPLVTGWDGFASCMRAYSLVELRALADSVEREVPGYRFSVGRTRRRLPGLRVTWLVGEPVEVGSAI
ncbi:MAG TPA: hypothetical protein VGO62_06945, partial [Myxococcota bacterium]